LNSKYKTNILNFIFALQKDVGHYSLNVSLTYLRGLEITELKKENMPTLSHIKLNYIRKV
tara:strand:- start:951 stop:1130 length:180 start_codon:yes stop_codon:yes gene_type:complete